MEHEKPDVAGFLARLRAYVDEDKVLVRNKALDEARAEFQMEFEDIVAFLPELLEEDFERIEPSKARPEDAVWVFIAEVAHNEFWIRLVERNGIVVISFHEAG